MTREDIDHLFELLNLYFPNTQKVHSKILKNAWHLLLEPYGPEDVKKALTAQLRDNKNFPDAQAIAVRCSASAHSHTDIKTDRYAPPTPSELRSYEELKSWQREWEKELHARGLQTLHEAAEAGKSPGEWAREITVAGAFQNIITESCVG